MAIPLCVVLWLMVPGLAPARSPVPRSPVGFVMACMRWPFPGSHDREWQRLSRDGRQELSYQFDEAAIGLVLGVSGQAQIERATVGFADGTEQTTETFGVSRDDGLY